MRSSQQHTQRHQRRWWTTLAIVLLAATQTAAQTEINRFSSSFNNYPETSRSCLRTAAANSLCDGTTPADFNICLCTAAGKGMWPILSAICIGKQAPGDLQQVYDLMESTCNKTATPLSTERRVFLAAAFDASTQFINNRTSTTAVALPTATGATTQAAAAGTSADDTGLSNMAKTGIIVAAAVVGSVLGAILTYFALLQCRRPPQNHNQNQRPPPGYRDSEEKPILFGPPGATMTPPTSHGFGYGASGNTPTSAGTTAVQSLHDWRMTEQQQRAGAGSPLMQTVTRSTMPLPSPLSNAGGGGGGSKQGPPPQWLLDPATGNYVLAQQQHPALAGMAPPPPPHMPQQVHMPPMPPATPPMQQQGRFTPPPLQLQQQQQQPQQRSPVEAPGTELALEMPSDPTEVPSWVRQHQQEQQQQQQQQQQQTGGYVAPQQQQQQPLAPYPIRTSPFPSPRHGGRMSRSSLSSSGSMHGGMVAGVSHRRDDDEGDSPSSVYSQHSRPPPGHF